MSMKLKHGASYDKIIGSVAGVYRKASIAQNTKAKFLDNRPKEALDYFKRSVVDRVKIQEARKALLVQLYD